jgi:phosphatidate cytidylyltransferase
MFKVRLISGVILMAITIAVIVLGGNVLFGVLLAISLIGLMELYKIVKINTALPGILGYIAAVVYYFLIYNNHTQHNMFLFITFLMLLMFTYVIGFPKYTTEQIAIAFLGFFYVSVMLSYIYQIRNLEDGALIIWLVFIGSWGSDTCAYCIGMLFGKHKVTPVLSPKKSLEGCIAGVVGAALIGFIYAMCVKNNLREIENPLPVITIIAAVSSIISQLGDLAASAIKRNHDIKDYGKLIPGHGGILDRFDSIIFTAPMVYYLALILKYYL